MRAKPFIPARLEVLADEGPAFVDVQRILREPELRDRCVEKRELRRIIKILEKQWGTVEEGRKSTTGR